jgi:hypothetical protein
MPNDELYHIYRFDLQGRGDGHNDKLDVVLSYILVVYLSDDNQWIQY